MPTVETIVRPKIIPKTELAEPSLFNVIYVNDDKTTMEFVVESLKVIFDYDEESAVALANRIHEEGSGIVATLPYEMAEQKGIEATLLARNNGFPLSVKLEQA
jgi:ATP-dependent Clp protease adaptor protein ClpS